MSRPRDTELKDDLMRGTGKPYSSPVAGQFLHSESPLIRRLSCLAYCVATLAGALFWAGMAGPHEFSLTLWFGSIIGAVPVWWVAAGVGLRVVRLVDRRRLEAAARPFSR